MFSVRAAVATSRGRRNPLASSRKGLLAATALVALLAAGPVLAQEAAGDEPVATAGGGGGDASELRFDVMEFEVSGNSVLKAADIQRALTPFTGFGKGVSDVETARAALEKAYRDGGYATVVVEVPAQDVRNGIVKLAVVEGRVDQVRVRGARYVLPSEIKDALPGLSEGVVPNVPVLQQQLSDANSRTTRTITPEFRAGQAPGTVDVDLVVEDKRPWGASIELNDQYNRSTERWRANASVHYDNLWQAGHSANLFFQTAPEAPDQIQVWSGSYYAPIGYGRTSLLAYAVQSNTDVATIGGLAVIGDGFMAGARVIHTLEGSPRGVVQSLMFGVDYKDYMDQIGLIDPATGDPLVFDTPVTYLPFTGQYRLLGGSPKSNYEVTLGATFAFDGLVGDQDEFGGVPDDPMQVGDQSRPGKRADSEASFFFLAGSASYTRRFLEGWDAKGALDWQLAAVPLISNEQFVLGGASSIRGFREAEVLGDSGFRMAFEVGRDIPFAWAGENVDNAIDWRVSAFAEGGGAFLNRPLPGEKSEFWLASVGLSTTFEVLHSVYGQLDLAYQFQDDPGGSGSTVPDDVGDLRLHVKIGVKY
jgi:hemolysin activation/secretion protein